MLSKSRRSCGQEATRPPEPSDSAWEPESWGSRAGGLRAGSPRVCVPGSREPEPGPDGVHCLSPLSPPYPCKRARGHASESESVLGLCEVLLRKYRDQVVGLGCCSASEPPWPGWGAVRAASGSPFRGDRNTPFSSVFEARSPGLSCFPRRSVKELWGPPCRVRPARRGRASCCP